MAEDNADEPGPGVGRAVVHIQDIGDVDGSFGEWIGLRGSGRWIEGFSVLPPPRIEADALEYRAAFDRRWLSPWMSGGAFCGSRGFSLPIFGLGLRLRGKAAEAYALTYSATFVDGTRADLVSAGEMCVAASLAPLEAIQVVLNPKGASTDTETKERPERAPYAPRTIASMTTEVALESLVDTPSSRAVLAPAG
ncbi:MAG TPA: hypothetical protein VIG49_10935, partial [Acetobacteraceae bacterium]